MTRNILATLVAGIALFAAAPVAMAQAYPSKPIRIVVPYPAGGTSDQVARALQGPMSASLKQPIIIDNKPGAAGIIGVTTVTKAEPDGYTLLLGNNGPNAIVPLVKKVPYDPLKDLRPISLAVVTPMLLAVPTNSPAQNMKEFLQYARKEGSKLNYGSTGTAGASHLMSEDFNEMARTNMTHVPYAGGAPLATALTQGDLNAAFVTGLDGAAMVSTGRIRYLAIGAPARSPAYPGIEPIAETVPGFSAVGWFGLFAPAGVPDDIIQKLNAAVNAALAQPEVRKAFENRNAEVRGSTPQELEDYVKSDMRKYAPIVRKGNIQMSKARLRNREGSSHA